MRSALRLAPMLVPWVLALTGCRLSYELLDNSDGSFGGAGPGPGPGPSGVGGTSAGSSSGLGGAEDPGDGGTGGDAPTGGSSNTGGASTGGVPSAGGSGGASSGGASSGGASSGGASSGGSGSGGASGSGGSGGSVPVDLPVTTTTDEDDPGATVGSPGQTGLSLREAITLANTTPGSQTIGLDPATYALGGVLPIITEGLVLAGGSAILDFSGASSANPCLHSNSSNVSIQDVEISGCNGEPVFLDDAGATGIELLRSYFHENGQAATVYGTGSLVADNLIVSSGATGLGINGPGAVVRGNEVLDSQNYGIFVSATADGVVLIGNLVVRSNVGIGFGGLSGATLWLNTVHASDGYGLSIGNATAVDFRNNIVTSSGTWGLNAADARFTVITHNLLFGNVSGGCNSCTPGAPYLTVDPLYENAGGDDYSLGAGSPAIDAGIDIGEPFGGTAPDLGYVESN